MKRDRKLQDKLLRKLGTSDHLLHYLESEYQSGDPLDSIRQDVWTKEEHYNLKLLAEEGLLRLLTVRGGPDLDYEAGEIAQTFVLLTSRAHDRIEENWYVRALNNVRSNVPTVVTSVIITLISAWLLTLTGLNK